MRLIGLAVTLTIVLALEPLAAEAQPGGRIATIGELWFAGAATAQQTFRQRLHELGYVEGRNIAIVSRASGREERLIDLAAELVRLKVEVILVDTTPALQAARRATRTIPIVMTGFGDAVAEGFVSNLARPDGNVTGLSWLTPESAGKRVELLKEILPKLARVAVLSDPRDTVGVVEVRALHATSRVMGLMLESFEVRDLVDLDQTFAAIKRARADALVVVDSARTMAQRARIAQLAAANHLPFVSEERVWADEGGLMTYGPRVLDLYKQAATYVDKILKGAKPADLPIEQPTRFELVINLKTAKALGLTIPQSLLLRADHVIE